MLPLANRIHRGTEIRGVVKASRRVNTATAIAYLRVNPGQEICRFGFICGKAVGNAVTRNLALRRFRSCCGKYLNDVDIGQLEVVFRIKPAAATLGFPQIERDIEKAVQVARAKMLRLQGGLKCPI